MLAKFTWPMSFTETTQTEATVIKTKRKTASGETRGIHLSKVKTVLFQSVENYNLARGTLKKYSMLKLPCQTSGSREASHPAPPLAAAS